jgi:4-amino-4-deoxy-L-arabinose transferase-like glycosyltransferase
VQGALDRFATPRARRLVLAAAAVLVLARLGAPDLRLPDEPRYALVAETMRSFEHGAAGLVLPHLHGEPYTQKPPLFFWLAAAAGAPFGRVTETAARLPSALASVATVAVVMAFGRLLGGRAAGVLAGLLLVTTIDWSFRARTVQLDTLLALCETAALYGFWRIESQAGNRRRNVLLLHAALGLGVLAKGPVGFVVPLLAIAAYLAWMRRLRELPALLPASGLALSLGLPLAWLAAAAWLAPPGWLDVAVVQNLFGRLGENAAHAQRVTYYLEKFPVDLLPWLVVLPLAIAQGRRAFAQNANPEERRAWRFLVAWIVTTFVFFSLTAGKRLRYLLPVEPAFALLFALALVRWLAARGPTQARAVVLAAGLVWTGQLVTHTAVLPRLQAPDSPRPIADAIRDATTPDERIGVYRAADLAHAIEYYGDRRAVPFRTRERLEAFIGSGGRTLVFESERRGEVEAVTPIDVTNELTARDETWSIARVRAASAP